ncbi:unnamed protein product [Cyclocybe aegerita]|uniref:AB hydrolase-1 domain-containing protein n=1 Tax=Cyclocybe aegerita TaxID=1973307 RepID=A0A8S0WVQ7_CYCAE|nr:unnamed protein product [Cyclocybe aegerita]
MDPTTLTKRFMTSRGFEYSYYRGPPSPESLVEFDPNDPPLPALLFLHGFPTSSHLWRHQFAFFRERGFLVLAPDLLGMGHTSKPTDTQAYRPSSICKDIVELLDAEGATQVIAIGHDMGSKIASRFANIYPERFLAFAFLAVPYSAPRPNTQIEFTSRITKKMAGYELIGHSLFYSEDDAAKLIESRLDSFFSAIFPRDPKLWATHVSPIGALRAWLEKDSRAMMAPYVHPDDISVWRTIISQEGIAAALCWHKAFTSGLNAEDDKDIPLDSYPIHKPVFFAAANHDRISQSVLGIAVTSYHCKNTSVRKFNDGHWLMMSSPSEVNQALFSWIMDCLP